MALSDNLIAYYSFEENFDEALGAENSIAPNAMRLESVNSPAGGTGDIYVRSVAGKIGLAAEGTEAASSVALAAASEHSIAIVDTDKTFAFWVKLTSTKQGDAILSKGGASTEYAFLHDGTDWLLFNDSQSVSYTHAPELDSWHFIVFWFDTSSNTAYLKVDDNLPVSGAFTVALQPGTAFRCAMGAVAMDELGIWERILTAQEMRHLYNGGDGMSYEEIAEDGQTGDCRESDCCPDDFFTYVATPGAGKGFDSVCEPLPKVIFEPPAGTPMIFPSLVLLRSDRAGATIHYTTDGSEPDLNSTIYTGAITVESPMDTIRAIAVAGECPSGPEVVAQWGQWTPAASFTYACTTTDKAGQWGAFAANGSDDYNWELQIQFTTTAAIKEFTILQLFPDGTFTGSCWSTKETIYPWEDDPDHPQLAFPLVIIINTVQQNSDYHDDYSTGVGTFLGPAAYVVEMHGQPWTSLPSDHLFKLLITFTDGSKIAALVDSTCDALPASLCPVPTFSSLTPACGPYRIDVTYALSVGTDHLLYRRAPGETSFTVVLNGLVASSPQTYQDTAVSPGLTYEYALANMPAGCAVWKYGPIVPVMATPNASVSISASAPTIGVGQSVTISWTSLNNSGTVSISPTIGAQAGNTPGSQAVSPASTTTYTITGQNACGTVATAQVTVNVEPLPSCGLVSTIIRIEDYTDSTFSFSACSGDIASAPGFTPWNGHFRSTPFSPCEYLVNSGQSIGGKELDTQTTLEISGGVWRLRILMDGIIADNYVLWQGTKGFGTTAAGVYTRTGGCAAAPATLTIVEI